MTTPPPIAAAAGAPATGSVSCRFCGRVMKQGGMKARGYCWNRRCVRAWKREQRMNRTPGKPKPVKDTAATRAAYDAGHKCGMAPESTGDENPFDVFPLSDRELREAWGRGWTDGAEIYIAQRDGKPVVGIPTTLNPSNSRGLESEECQRCMATPCMCAAVPAIKEILKQRNQL